METTGPDAITNNRSGLPAIWAILFRSCLDFFFRPFWDLTDLGSLGLWHKEGERTRTQEGNDENRFR
jgi:hypothetical protein